ncbi:hypothetical protein ACQ86N_06820 [Puia sp. P3]|uniref:hypothetical protein n=1 Tax=Puia sp. P3 TaxID=3423952 RepID=UPI003D66ACEE
MDQNGKTTIVLTGHPVNAADEEMAFFASMDPELKYPMNKMKPIIEAALNKNLNTGLQQLKGALEN